MLFRQFVGDDLGCASYLIGDPEAGVAVVVDPAYAIEQYVEAAEAEGVRIVRTMRTPSASAASRYCSIAYAGSTTTATPASGSPIR